jgi:hypothetical protein
MFNSTGTGLKVALLAVLAGMLMAAGCHKPKVFPDEPKIKFERMEIFGDSASLTISFTDGDGDIGLDIGDNVPPFDSLSVYYNNLFLTYEERQNGAWIQPSLALENNFRIPRITPTGQNKVLQGEISVGLQWPIRPGAPYDTVRFHIRLLDRALHESNTVTTPDILVE